MKRLAYSGKIYIDESTISGAGRGVFAAVDIKKGDIIERCPVIELPLQDAPGVNMSDLVNYIYYLGKNKERLVLALGFGSIYNHSTTPNAIYIDVRKENVLEFMSLRIIKKGEEITVDYAQGNKKYTGPLWFMVT